MLLDHHVCLLFDRAEEIPALVAKLRNARKETDCWVFVANGEAFPGAGSAADVLKLDVTVDADALGMRELPISIKLIVGKLRELAGSMIAGGKGSVTFLLDMSWLLHTPSGIAHMGEFETCLHQLLVASPIRSICLFNRQFFPEGLMLDVLRTHPYLYDSQGIRSNPHFLPPHAYLTGDPAEQLESWMANLGPVVESCWTDEPALELRTGSRSTRESPKLAAKQAGEEFAGIAGPDIESPDLAKDKCLKQNRWKIRSLGHLRIYRQDGTPVRWDRIHGATVKTKTLFAMLLQKGTKGLGAEEIADLLWADSPSMIQSMNRLYHTIHCLRMALDPSFSSGQGSSYVVCLDHRYYLNLPEGTWVDGPIFEQFCRKGEQLLKARNLEESLACHQVAERLYSGSLFSDIPDKYAANTENDWCWSRRYWLEEMYVKMLTYTARIYRELEQTDQAVIFAEKALRIEPCFELAHQEAIRAFQVMGRHDAIERQYRLCCEALRRFEERAPSSQTRALFQSLVTT